MASTPLMFKRTASGLAPASAYDAEELDRYAIGAEVEVTIRQRRSGRNHRHFFVVLARIVESGATPFQTSDQLLDALKMSCGMTEMRQAIGGAPYFIPASISFAKLPETEFRDFKQRAFALIASHYSIDPASIERDAA